MSSKVVTSSTGSTGLQEGVQEHLEHKERSTRHGLFLWSDEKVVNKLKQNHARFDEVADENVSRAPSPLGLPQHETCPGLSQLTPVHVGPE